MKFAFGKIDFTEEKIIKHYSRCLTIICTRVCDSKERAIELSKIIWTAILKKLPQKTQAEDFTILFFTILKNTLLENLDDYPISETRLLKSIPKEPLNPGQKIDLLQKCDGCLSNQLLRLNHKSRIIYLYRDLCKLSYKMLCKIFEEDEHKIRKNLNKSRRQINAFLDINCALYNSDAKCKLSKQLKDSNIEQDIKFVRIHSERENVFMRFESLNDRDYFWKL